MGYTESDIDDKNLKVVLDTAIGMLMAGEDLFVNRNDYTPPKINARESSNFSSDDVLLEQPVDLSWISKKGFRVGVIFYGSGRIIKMVESFPLDTNTFIARFDLAGIYKSITSIQGIVEPDNIRAVLSAKNSFSSWLFWPNFPAKYVQPFIQETQELVETYYGQQIQQSEPTWGETIIPSKSETIAVNATYKGCKRSKNTGDIFYRFSVTYDGKTERYHLIYYDNELYLFDYIYDSVPVNNPMYKNVLIACKSKIPH
ncbi:hypothetical protein [Xenorhabdus sp. KJ12.1]|uniref:hypothetical protein n=1 Tax=Xenorhabdus sp. KJ12.1 TaxID=1851571 RepID=UPI000C0474BD|nr:hypothetical protein [Xenorhabdus sp. KJ12.1]PHM72348.1 hypothetical protein Xekj_00627 [Xenorhabdus sp. KJ12.1]